jgi:hypothetical protein
MNDSNRSSHEAKRRTPRGRLHACVRTIIPALAAIKRISAIPLDPRQGQESISAPGCYWMPSNKWRSDMNKLVMLMTSAALTMLIGAGGAYAESNRRAPDATYGQQDRGTAIDTQATGEEGISGPRVKVKPGDVIDGGRVIGADPDPFIRDQLLREYNSGRPD